MTIGMTSMMLLWLLADPMFPNCSRGYVQMIARRL